VIQKDLTEEELYELYLSCHCFVNPNKGEGFGLIPREFAATGGISLTTNWGGTSEALDLWGWPLPYEVSVADWKGHRALEGKDLGNWANPHPDEISKVMRYVVDNREEYQKRAMIISSQVPEMYSWGKFAEEIYGVWKDILNGNGRSDIMAS
jgi:glycosyltransferase involved in cell wall biosynthesis